MCYLALLVNSHDFLNDYREIPISSIPVFDVNLEFQFICFSGYPTQKLKYSSHSQSSKDNLKLLFKAQGKHEFRVFSFFNY